MIFTNYRSSKLRVQESLYRDREARLAKLIELKAPPFIIKDAALLLASSFKWSWRGLLSDVWMWVQYTRLGWWAQWLLSTKFRRETDAAGLEMMALLEEDIAQAEHTTAVRGAEATGQYHDESCARDTVPYVTCVPSQRRRFAESWDVWRKRVKP